ncbi:MAG: DegV family protein [Erysipelotrichaceae bacterium]
MNNYVVFSDVTSDLSSSIYNEYPVNIIDMNVLIDEKEFLHTKDFKNLSSSDFYKILRDGGKSSTSQITPAIFVNIFETYLKQGNDILYLCFSSGLSNTYNSALLAQRELKEMFPNQEIKVVDTLLASAGEGLLVYHALENQKKGMSLSDNYEWLENHKMSVCSWFTVDDLMFLQRGGRISGITAVIGTTLKIKPILHVDDDGKLVNVTKVRGRKLSINFLATKLKESILDDCDTIFISHGDCLEDALTLKKLILETLPHLNVYLSEIGPVIGSHSGPDTIALFFLGSHR